MSDTYWHFIRINDAGQPYLGYEDGRIVQVGEPVTVEGTPVPCKHGLHASKRILDALRLAPPNSALSRVTLGGQIVHEGDKPAAQERTILQMLTVEQTGALLRQFSRWAALQVAHLWDMPPVVHEYLETGNEALRKAAAYAASAAARNADDATRDAAYAAHSAAHSAAASAARAAAYAASAASAAAYDAAAASAAAYDAAYAAEQETELQRLWAEAIAAQEAAHE